LAENSSQSRSFLPPFHRYIDTWGFNANILRAKPFSPKSSFEVCGHRGYSSIKDWHQISIHSPAGGGERRFLLLTPPDYAISEQMPIILAFHDKGQNASEMEFQTQFPAHNSTTTQSLLIHKESASSGVATQRLH
jgi:hypothetical protein